MKYVILNCIVYLYFVSAFSQTANIPVDEDTGLITWQEVVTQNGTPEILFNRTIEWINSFFPNPQGATKIRDIDNGRIVINHSMRMFNKHETGEEIVANTVVNYVLRIELRDNRYRYTFTEFTMRASSRFPLERWLDTTHQSYQAVWADYLVQVEETVKKTIDSMKEGMKEKVVKEDIW